MHRNPNSTPTTNWLLYTPIVEKICTLHELQTIYSLSDLIDFHIVILKIKLMEKSAHDS